MSCADYRNVTITSYAYLNGEMNVTEYHNANCRKYGQSNGLQFYSLCDGSPLRLTDSQFGPEYYPSSHDHNYYVMKGTIFSLMYKIFLFALSEPTRLDKIRLHYYSDLHGGKILPVIYFFAIRDDQLVYDNLHAYETLGVVGSPFSETVNGRTNVTITVSSSSLPYSKVLMHISFLPYEKFFYLSEVEFFTLSSKSAATTNSSLLQGIDKN